MSYSEALPTFFAESRGLLHDMEEALLRLEAAPDDTDAINAVFRAAHTIKGSAGLFGMDTIVAFTHSAETVLDQAREGHLAVDAALADLLLECRDHLDHLLNLAETETPADADTLARDAGLRTRLDALAGAPASPAGRGDRGVALPGAGAGALDSDDVWHISVRFGRDVLRNGMDPSSFLRYLAGLGEIVHLTTLADALPAREQMDPESCYLGFEIRFQGNVSKEQIEKVFEFVRDDCELRILPPGSQVADYARLIRELPEDDLRLGELLRAAGVITERELEEVLAVQECEGLRREPVQPLGELLVERGAVQPEVVDAALERQRATRQAPAREDRFIRVQADKLDSLINLVGEMVIAGAGVGLLAGRHGDAPLLEAVSGLSRLVEEIRDGAMRLRMVEIGETFNRFRRVVRDVSRELGKDIELVIGGADTELDKSVVERIGDPLTHLVRNAMDHGIEPAEVRLARGKPARGTLRLNAYHESGGIVIEVGDDGGGLNPGRILRKAVDRGLLAADAQPAEQDIYQLIFEPGFSTADQVSNLSGRGVGMDVVKRNIEALRGTVEIDSRPGEGAVFRIRLPLTLAIIDGFLVRVANGHYVVPLDTVLECVELDGGADQGNDYLNLRGEVLPLLPLRRHFALDGRATGRANVVVVHCGGRKAGLVVDELKGELQAVIKPLGRLFARLRGISGSTILGSGEVALMLDVPLLMDEAARQGSRRETEAA